MHPPDSSQVVPPRVQTLASHLVVLDTNAVLDWLVFRSPHGQSLGHALAQCWVRWVATQAMLDELLLVLHRPMASRWELHRKQALTTNWSDLVQVTPAPCLGEWGRLRCSDPSDQKFIDLALALPAAWLISHDRALLKLRKRAGMRGVQVGTPAQWCASMQALPGALSLADGDAP